MTREDWTQCPRWPNGYSAPTVQQFPVDAQCFLLSPEQDLLIWPLKFCFRNYLLPKGNVFSATKIKH